MRSDVMSKNYMAHYQTRVKRASMQTESPSAERDRKRSAPVQSSVFLVDEERPKKSSSRRSSGSGGSTSRKVQSGAGGGHLNRGYGGSVSSMPSVSGIAESETTVIREQYCACARWSRMQQLLLLAVGVLTGIVAGLIIVVLLLAAADEDIFENLLRSAPPTQPPEVDPIGVSS